MFHFLALNSKLLVDYCIWHLHERKTGLEDKKD